MAEPIPPVPLPSRIASLVHAHFDALPTRSKPSVFPDGSREWIPMTGIVVVKGENTPSESLHCISITTGAKCLSASHIPRCRGLVLHDCHAEILAIRALNYWLLTECHGLVSEEQHHSTSKEAVTTDQSEIISPFIRRRMRNNQEPTSTSSEDWPPFELRSDVNIYMYCTCAPCGDASMELCMASQEDATPWEVRQTNPCPETQGDDHPPEESMLDGRAHFSLLGVVRRKPARMDAESTRSKSCSDKLALRQVSSLLSCETSRLIAPTENAYLAGLILPEDEITRVGCERAFGAKGRMAALAGKYWPGGTANEKQIGYRFRPFRVLAVPAEEIDALWPFAKPKSLTSLPPGADGDTTQSAAIPKTSRKSKPGTVSAIWAAAPSFPHSSASPVETGSKTLPALRKSKTGIYETLINGLKQGTKASAPSARGASSLSRAKLWSLFQNIVSIESCGVSPENALIQEPTGDMSLSVWDVKTYEGLKRAGRDSLIHVQARAEAMRDAKEVLKGWIPNPGDEDWGLDVLIDPKKRAK